MRHRITRLACRMLLGLLCVSAAPPDTRAAAPGASDGAVLSAEPGWPQWRGPGRDGHSAETGLLQAWPEGGPRLLWQAGGLGLGWASAITSRDTVYVTGDVGDQLVIRALDRDGSVRWCATNGAAWKGSYPGARACPALANGRLYHLNAHGRVACLDAATGRELWTADLAARFACRVHTWALSECVLLDGSRLLVTPAGEGALMAALDSATGATVWTAAPIAGEQPSYCSPLLVRHAGRRLALNCTSRHAWAVDADTGQRAWTIPFQGRWYVTTATPVYGGGRVFLAAPDGPGGRQFLLAASNAVPVETWNSPVDALTGGALLCGGRLYANGCKSTKTLHTLDWESGRVLGDLPRLRPGASSHPSAALLWADGRVYAFFEYGTLALLKPAPTGLEVVGRVDLVPGPPRDAWAHPALCDGRLYVRHHDTLWCFDVRAAPAPPAAPAANRR